MPPQIRRSQDPISSAHSSSTSQASAGIYAFGDLILFVGVFGVLALFPTMLTVYFLVRKFLTR